jgi:hypothetical protein
MTVEEAAVFWYLPQFLSPEHRQKLIHFREELDRTGTLKLLPAFTMLHDDLTLLRFLKARAWSVHKALKLFQVGEITTHGAFCN